MKPAESESVKASPSPRSEGEDLSVIAQVVLRERQGRDRGWWDQMEQMYWPDASIDLSWYHGDAAGFVAGSKAQYERGSRPVHHMFAPVILRHGDRAHVEMSVSTWSTWNIEDKLANFSAFMRLNYRLECRDEQWRISSLNVIYEYATATPAVPGQVIEIPVDELAQYRPSYAILAWRTAQGGLAPSNDELGEDRPDEIAEFYAKIQDWLDG